MFYYFRLEDQIPETHLLRLIKKHISFALVRERLKDSYSETGRPSMDPELLLRILLIGYLYGITSERKLVEELRMHLAWRWFTGLGFDQEIPHHSTFSKNRHGRFQESNLFEQLFEEIVAHCLQAGLVQSDHLSVDGSFIPANASTSSRIAREQLPEAAQVKRTVREYLAELEQENPTEEPVHEQERVSTADLRRLRLRRMKFVREQFFLAAAAQNIKRLVRFLSQMPRPPLAATVEPRPPPKRFLPSCGTTHHQNSLSWVHFFNSHSLFHK